MHTLSYIYMCNIGFIHELGRNVAWYGCHYRRCFMIQSIFICHMLPSDPYLSRLLSANLDSYFLGI